MRFMSLRIISYDSVLLQSIAYDHDLCTELCSSSLLLPKLLAIINKNLISKLIPVFLLYVSIFGSFIWQMLISSSWNVYIYVATFLGNYHRIVESFFYVHPNKTMRYLFYCTSSMVKTLLLHFLTIYSCDDAYI